MTILPPQLFHARDHHVIPSEVRVITLYLVLWVVLPFHPLLHHCYGTLQTGERHFHAYPSWISMTAMKWSSEVIRNLTVKEPKCAMNVMNWQSTPCLWVNASKARCGGCSWYDPRSENLDYQTMTCCALPLFVIWLRHSSTHSIIMEFINSGLNIGQTTHKH